MIQGTCIDTESLRSEHPDHIFRSIRNNNKLYTVKYTQPLEGNDRQLEYKESVLGPLEFALIDPSH